MTKTILTYSWLARKAMALFRRDRDEYVRLVTDGSDRLVRGLKIHWNMQSQSAQMFTLLSGDKRYCCIYGMLRDGKVYSYYDLRIMPTTYKKRITDKYLPITLPDGVRSRHNIKGGSTKCILHNADGTVADETLWQSGRRGRSGDLVNGAEIIICDTTGKFCGDSKTMESLDLGAYYEDNRPMIGWFHAASRTRTDWINSIKEIPAGMCDHTLMGKAAAKAYLSASRLVEKYPHVRMVLFPARPFKDQTKPHFDHYRHGGEMTPSTVMKWEGETAISYFLPEVYLYWDDGQTDQQQHVAWKGLSMMIPPHGNPLLDPTGKGALSCNVRRVPQASRWYNEKCEMPYHSILAWKPGATKWKEMGHGFYRNHEGEMYDPNYGNRFGEQDKELVLWYQHPEMVLVKSECQELENVEMPVPLGHDFAMRPEDVAAKFEEKLLLESLPLC